ncbi:MAG: hypothetical protein JNK22_08380 [Rhodocyclaceae bacterium]|nr:hypothetical protein [Rhodocyclaceae bacterium]
MRVSWLGLLFAPLPVPLLVAGFLMATLGSGQAPFTGFATLFLIGGALSYGATLFLLMPAVLVLQRLTTLTSRAMILVGAGLGLVAGAGITRIMHQASGPDSGPPETGFFEWMAADDSGALYILFCMACGTVNALLYHLLARREGAA